MSLSIFQARKNTTPAIVNGHHRACAATETTSEIITVSPGMATEWLKSFQYNKQRPLDQRAIDRYSHDMSLGRWIGISDAIYLVEIGLATHMINGQHRMHAIIQSGTAQKFLVVREHVNSTRELEERYRNTDQGSMRNFADIRGVQPGLDNQDLTNTNINRLKAAAFLIFSAFKRQASTVGAGIVLSHIDMVEMSTYWLKEGTEYINILDGKYSKFLSTRLRAAPVMAIGMLTLRYDHDRALEFWQSVAENSGLTTNDPRKTLVDMLIEHKIPQAQLEVHMYCQRVGNCWNAHCESRTLKIAKAINTDKIYIAMTPFTKTENPIGIGLSRMETSVQVRAQGSMPLI